MSNPYNTMWNNGNDYIDDFSTDEIIELEGRIKDIEDEIQYMENEIENSEYQLYDLKSDNGDWSLKNEIQHIEEEIKGANEIKRDLEKKLIDLKGELEFLKGNTLKLTYKIADPNPFSNPEVSIPNRLFACAWRSSWICKPKPR